MRLLAPTSVADLADRITILRIKSGRIREADKLRNIGAELVLLQGVWDKDVPSSLQLDMLVGELQAVNVAIWQLEDAARDSRFGDDTSRAALLGSINATNDRRAGLKRSINLLSGSELIEEKSHPTGMR